MWILVDPAPIVALTTRERYGPDVDQTSDGRLAGRGQADRPSPTCKPGGSVGKREHDERLRTRGRAHLRTAPR
jgi:hypothetical protein